VAQIRKIREYRTLTPDALDALELAVRERKRVALRRRGTEYVVVAERLETSGRDEALAGRLPMTGEVLTFRLRDLETFAVLP
jgi:transcriptional antiterminator Rof (Rho-off)